MLIAYATYRQTLLGTAVAARITAISKSPHCAITSVLDDFQNLRDYTSLAGACASLSDTHHASLEQIHVSLANVQSL